MKTKPLISIIVVAYNYAQYLPRCLDAILKQGFKDYEVVIVNNGSTDNSELIIKKYMEENPNVLFRYILIEKNIGLPNGRNTGLQNATGEYIIFNDADDWMESNCLEKLAEVACRTKADKVEGYYSEVDQSGKILRVCEYPQDFTNWFSTALQGVIYRRKFFIDNNFILPLETKIDDIYLNIYFHTYTKKVAYVRESIFNYYVNQMSTSGAKNNNKKWNSVTLIEDCFENLMPLYKTLGSEDKVMLEYVLVKQYYFYYLHNNRYNSFKVSYENYIKAHDIIMAYCPHYLKNKNITLVKKNGDRKSGRKIVWLMSRIEKFHMMKLFLRVFLFVSKKHYLTP